MAIFSETNDWPIEHRANKRNYDEIEAKKI